MNSSQKSLSEVLREWRVAPPSDPNFRHRVWQRLSRTLPSSWPAYLRGHAVAWTLLTVLTVSGAALTGHVAAQKLKRGQNLKGVRLYISPLLNYGEA